jgi:tight adherence protein B
MKTELLIGIIAIVAVILVISVILIIIIKNRRNYEVIEVEDKIINKDEKSKVKENKSKVVKEKKKKEEAGILPNYNYYKMSVKELILWGLLGMAVAFAVGYVFYQSIAWAAVISLPGLFYPKMKNKDLINARKVKLLLQFKEALYALSSSLSAGKSVPMAFKDCYNDLKLMYEETSDCYILDELQFIIRRIDRNETIEDALADFAERSALDDVQTFAYIFTTCTRTGGNLKEVIRNSSQIIGDKIEIKQDIDVIVSGKKFEQKILSLIPVVLVAFLYMSAPDFMAPLKSISGRMITTVSIILILIGNLWAKKIMKIEV